MNKISERDKKFSFHTKARNLAILSEMSKALERECYGSSLLTISAQKYRGFNVVPHKAGGIVMMSQCRFATTIIRDPDGNISLPCRLVFPKHFLKKCRHPKLLKRLDMNCQPYECEASVPAFMVPDQVSAIYCGAFINGSGDLPEDDADTGIFSCRAEWGDSGDDWSLWIDKLSIDPVRVVEKIEAAPEAGLTTTMTVPAMRSVSRTVEAHFRESDPELAGVWYSRTLGVDVGGVVVYRNALDPNIVICTSLAENRGLSGEKKPLDDAIMPEWMAGLSDGVTA
ncbi:hypothetical protein [Acetobacter sp.]|uniref:hypothetical protein n=1 Tax=Acetobacter sp. TaxID=440 RepID=UPI0039EA8321